MRLNIKKSLLITGAMLSLSGCAMNSYDMYKNNDENYDTKGVVNNAVYNGGYEPMPEQAELKDEDLNINSIDINSNNRYSRNARFEVKTKDFDKTNDSLSSLKQEYKDDIVIESEISEIYNDSLDKYGEPIEGLDYRVLSIRLGVKNDKFYSVKERFGELGNLENYYEEQVIINESGYSDKQARIDSLEKEIDYLEKELLNQYSDVETKLYVRDRILSYSQELLSLKSDNKNTDNTADLVSVSFTIFEELEPEFIHQKTQEHNNLIASREKADAIADAKKSEQRRALENEIDSITRKNIVSEINQSFTQGVNNSYNLIVDLITLTISNMHYLILLIVIFGSLKFVKGRRVKKLKDQVESHEDSDLQDDNSKELNNNNEVSEEIDSDSK